MPQEWAEPQLRRMVEALRHESFYRIGMWVDESLGVYMGWVVRESSFCDGMPFRNERGDVVLAFSGEDFPEPGTANRLKERGHDFEPKGASYLPHAYEEDPAFPAGLNGRFHGVLTDRTRGTAMLFNDRYGMHRMYYHEGKEAFYFAAEAKAILKVQPELRTVDSRGLGEIVAFGCVLENRTLFKRIQILPPGAAWVFRQGSIEQKNAYFQPQEWENQSPLDAEDYYLQLRDTFSRNLPRYFNGQQRIAMSLTGGLDTRMIMAWQRCSPGALPCYTFGGTYRDCRDVLVARQVARVCGQRHEVIATGDEFLSRFCHYAERSVYLADGCVDTSRAPALYVNEKARQIAPVRIAGIYGGEVTRRLRGFKPWEPAPGLFRPELLSHVQTAKKTYAGLVSAHPVSFTLFGQTPQRGVDTLEESQLDVRCPYLDNDLVRTAFRAPEKAMVNSDAAANNHDCLRLIADGNAALRRIQTDRGLAGDGLTAPISRGYLEFSFKAEYAYDYGMPQWVARIDHLFSPFHLERLFLGRHKFYHFRVWYREALSKYVQEMLLDRRTLSRPYLDRNGLERIVRGHLKGNRNYTNEIHKVLTLEILHRLFVDPR
jgi:asparagine synthase (glutamine-hydrolysing)